MLKSNKDYNEKYLSIKRLQALINNLEIGMLVDGRVIEHIKRDRYIVRIRGYNIYTQSENDLNVGDELKFKILKLEPHLILNPQKPKIEDHSTGSHTDIIVH